MSMTPATQAAIKVQPLAQVLLRSHLDAARPPHAGQAHRAEKNSVEFLQPVEHLRRQRVASAQLFARPYRQLFVNQLRRDDAQHTYGFRNNIRPHPVTGKKCDR